MALEFVLIYCRHVDYRHHVLLILKDRPAELAGRFNLPGGKIEPGETPVQAAIRELEEETGYNLQVEDAEHLGILQTSQFKVHCVRVFVADDGPPKPRASETEKAVWMTWEQFVDDDRVIPNLKTIAPMMHFGVQGFTVFQKTDMLEVVFE